MVNSLIIALLVLFIHATTWEGHIFEGVKKIIPPDAGDFYKPIYGCPICMTPWWGSVIYLIFFPVDWRDWFIVVGSAAGMSVISVVLISIRKACVVYVKNNEKNGKK